MKIQAEAGFVIRTEKRMSDRVLLDERGLKTDGIMSECFGFYDVSKQS